MQSFFLRAIITTCIVCFLTFTVSVYYQCRYIRKYNIIVLQNDLCVNIYFLVLYNIVHELLDIECTAPGISPDRVILGTHTHTLHAWWLNYPDLLLQYILSEGFLCHSKEY